MIGSGDAVMMVLVMLEADMMRRYAGVFSREQISWCAAEAWFIGRKHE